MRADLHPWTYVDQKHKYSGVPLASDKSTMVLLMTSHYSYVVATVLPAWIYAVLQAVFLHAGGLMIFRIWTL